MENILGIDIGGSGIKGALVDIENGELVTDRIRIPTPEGARPDDVAQTVGELISRFQYSGLVGCGFPAVVLHGIVKTAANIHTSWIGLNVDALLSHTTSSTVYTGNDADVAGLAEMRFGAGRGRDGVVLVLTLGTGIGSAIFIDGKLVPNTEFGHLKIRGKDAEHRASDAVRQAKGLSWEKYAQRLQEFLTEMESLIWPDLIIIGGGISKQSKAFFPYLNTQAEIVPARLLNQAGIIGAALYADTRR